MADLEPLIRVRRHTVEQKQKFLAELYRQAELLASTRQALLDGLQSERDAVEGSGDPEMLRDYKRYADGIRKKIAGIDKELRRLDTRIEIAREDMRDAFAELKKIEITHERREDEARAELKKQEAQTLDEIAVEGFRRRDDQ